MQQPIEMDFLVNVGFAGLFLDDIQLSCSISCSFLNLGHKKTRLKMKRVHVYIFLRIGRITTDKLISSRVFFVVHHNTINMIPIHHVY